MSLLVRGATVGERVVHVRVRDGLVVELGPGLRRDGEEVLDASGQTVIPGLHDHHLHLHALASDLQSVRCGPPMTADAFAAALHGATEPIRGTGYHESVAGPLDRHVLDALVGDQQVRIQHRSGAAWFLSSAALAAYELLDSDDLAVERDAAGRATGRLLRGDHLLRTSAYLPDLTAVGQLLAQYGVTGVTDATPQLSERAATALREAALPQRLLLLGAALDDRRRDVGPWKVLLDEAKGLDLDAVTEQVRACRAAGRAVAFHAVTVAEAVVALTALKAVEAMPGDRLEHGSLLPPDLDKDLQSLAVTVVTQPSFVVDRGDDYLADVDARDHALLYRCRSLIDAGVPVAGSTDAPYGDPDPWRAVAAAVTRRTRNGVTLGADETLQASRALALFLGPATNPGGLVRRIAPGEPADLCLLDAPLEVVLREPSSDHVAATVIAGELVYVRA
ncbi:MAG: putative amidase [Frankiales bacterium]|nr:putative amidase [Frankiales bacterium]